MDKKIAIATWYTNGNHGGTLQAFALQKIVYTLGYESEFVNYSPKSSSLKYRVERFLKDLAIDILKPKVGQTRRKIYKFVDENLDISKQYCSYSDLIEDARLKYFAAICGSDQIWANVGDRIDEINYLTFIENEKRIAYAPSTGYNRIDKKIEDKFVNLVRQIRFLSVREKQGAEFIYDTTGCKAEVMLDPSLLLNKSQWEYEIRKHHITKEKPEKYIFAYFLGGNPEHAKFAYELSEKTGFPIITIDMKNSVFNSSDKIIADPLEFLDIINNAEYVLTDSFHGVALSINLEKQFIAFKRFKDDDPNNQNARIFNILEKTGLQDRLTGESTPIDSLINNKFDYSQASNLLEAERHRCIDYLKNAIETVMHEQYGGGL